MERLVYALLHACEFGIIEDLDNEDGIIVDAIRNTDGVDDIGISTTVENIKGKDSLSVTIGNKQFCIEITNIEEI